jgi:hypothetical protein
LRWRHKKGDLAPLPVMKYHLGRCCQIRFPALRTKSASIVLKALKNRAKPTHVRGLVSTRCAQRYFLQNRRCQCLLVKFLDATAFIAIT